MMKPYVIRQGDYLTKLAHQLGFDADAVWNDDANSALREKRPNRDILHPGDVLQVPVEPPAPLAVTAQAANRFQARVPTVEIRVKLSDGEQNRYASKAFRVEGMGKAFEGTTDGDGLAIFAVPTRVREVTLTMVEAGETFHLLIGGMDPVDRPSGVRKRLAHLGFLPLDAEHDDESDEALRNAISMFQHIHQIAITGELDQATRDALTSAHGEP
jgi:hypothetical protein